MLPNPDFLNLKPIDTITTLDALCNALRTLNTPGKSDPKFIPTEIAFIENTMIAGRGPITSGYGQRAGDVMFRAYKGDVLWNIDSLRALHERICSNYHANAGNGRAVIKETVDWLKSRGHDLYGKGRAEGPFTALVEALKVVVASAPISRVGKAKKPAPKSVAALEKRTPALICDNGVWVKNTLAAQLESVQTATLRQYRNSGRKNEDATFGCDPEGRIWRRSGTDTSHPWYLKSSLKSSQQKPYIP